METIGKLFEQVSKTKPDKIAIWCDGRTKTYKELYKMVNQYSHLLSQYGVKYGDHIGIPMNNSIESVVLMMSAACMGITLVPINPTLPISATKVAFQYGHIKHLIARKAFLQQLDQCDDFKITGKVFCMDKEYGNSVFLGDYTKYADEAFISYNVSGEENFIITMTSGSTGSPKPICLTQRNKYERAIAHIQMYHLTEEDHILAATPLYHSLAERLVLMPLLIGATSVLLPRFTAELWLKCIKEQKVTFSIAVSAQLNQVSSYLSKTVIQEIDSLRCLVSSSALLEENIKYDLIEKLQCEFHEMYGTSETSTITDINFREAVDKKKSVGRALKEASIRILDKNGKDVSCGEIGEIACHSSLLCAGYYDRKDLFEKSMRDGYFCTGDLGYLDDDGYLYFCGRKKEIIITGGINVYPSDIENCILQISQVEQCAAFAYPDENLGESVAVAIVLKEGETIDKRVVQVQCVKNLADYQQPHHVFFVEELPRNSMGKVVKTLLPEYVRTKNREI